MYLVLLGLYYAATDGVLMALASATLPPSLRGSGLALLVTSTSLGRLMASILFGMLWTWYDVETAIAVFAVGSVRCDAACRPRRSGLRRRRRPLSSAPSDDRVRRSLRRRPRGCVGVRRLGGAQTIRARDAAARRPNAAVQKATAKCRTSSTSTSRATSTTRRSPSRRSAPSRRDVHRARLRARLLCRRARASA